MSLLTDTDIEDYLKPEDESALIFPFSEKCLTPIGYDLRAGGKYATSDEGHLFELKKGMELVLRSKQTALVSTLEKGPSSRRDHLKVIK